MDKKKNSKDNCFPRSLHFKSHKVSHFTRSKYPFVFVADPVEKIEFLMFFCGILCTQTYLAGEFVAPGKNRRTCRPGMNAPSVFMNECVAHHSTSCRRQNNKHSG
jgi:hypothetical protein